MFTWMGLNLDAILNTYVLGVVSSLMDMMRPVALTSMTVWVTLFGWAVLRGDVTESIPVFLWKAFKLGLVMAFALQAGFYVSNVADTANALALGVASTFLPSNVDPAAVATPYALLDRFNDLASVQVADIMQEASMFRLDLLLAAAVFSLGSVAFLCLALYVVTLSKLFLTFVIAIGPLFVLCLAWRPTQRFFDSWLSMLLNVVVLTWFSFFALGLSTFLGAQMFAAIQSGGGFLGGTFNVLGEATRYCILMILMAIICFQAPSLASALTGGTAVQQGIQIIHNTMLVTGQRSASMTQAAEGRPSAGGVIGAGTGAPYAMGAAAATSYRVAQRSLNLARTAAYRRAALRANA